MRKGKKNLRKFLGRLVAQKNGKNWYKKDLFKKYILPKFPEEIEIISLPPNVNKQFNCFIFTFGLEKNRKILRDSKGFICSSFAEKLIDAGQLRKAVNPKKGCLIFYRNTKKFGKTITHAGILADHQKVISKWSWGPVLKHKIFDVPDFYGDEITYYKPISKDKIAELYKVR